MVLLIWPDYILEITRSGGTLPCSNHAAAASGVRLIPNNIEESSPRKRGELLWEEHDGTKGPSKTVRHLGAISIGCSLDPDGFLPCGKMLGWI